MKIEWSRPRPVNSGVMLLPLGNIETMDKRVTVFIAFFILIGLTVIFFFTQESFAQEGKVSQGGCSALDKSKPPLFISFENPDEKAWAGDKYVKGALLRLNNNSNCTVSFSAQYGEAPKVPLHM